MSDQLLDRPTQDDLQSEQIHALLEGQHQLAKQMAEIVLAHQAIVRRHEEDMPRIERIEATLVEVKDLVSTVAALKGGLKVLGWFGAAVKWITLVGGPLYVAGYAITHGGKLPPAP